MSMSPVQRFGSRPADVRVSRGDAWEEIRLGYERRAVERATARVGRMVAAVREQQARRDGYRPETAA